MELNWFVGQQETADALYTWGKWHVAVFTGCCRGMLWHKMPFRVQEGAWCPLSTALVEWQGVTVTRECLGITPVMKFPLPPQPKGCWCTGWERNREFPSLNQGRRNKGDLLTMTFWRVSQYSSHLWAGINLGQESCLWLCKSRRSRDILPVAFSSVDYHISKLLCCKLF